MKFTNLIYNLCNYKTFLFFVYLFFTKVAC